MGPYSNGDWQTSRPVGAARFVTAAKYGPHSANVMVPTVPAWAVIASYSVTSGVVWLMLPDSPG